MGTDSYFLMMILSHAIKNKLLYEVELNRGRSSHLLLYRANQNIYTLGFLF